MLDDVFIIGMKSAWIKQIGYTSSFIRRKKCKKSLRSIEVLSAKPNKAWTLMEKGAKEKIYKYICLVQG